jgi:CRP/FNR family cyclic AMP-dependent transcriptional regulator
METIGESESHLIESKIKRSQLLNCTTEPPMNDQELRALPASRAKSQSAPFGNGGRSIPASSPAARTRTASPVHVFPGDSLLSSLPRELSERLFSRSHPVFLKAGRVLFSAGEEGNGCYLLREGLLKVTVGLSPESRRVIAVLVPGSVAGELSMIDGSPRSADITAIKDSKLGFVSRTEFHAFADDHPEVFRHLIPIVVRRLRDTNVVVAETTFLSLKGRVARALLGMAEGFGRDVGAGRILIGHKVTQGDVAAMAGIARENASRIMNEWVRAGVISRVSAYYCIENRAALAKASKS